MTRDLAKESLRAKQIQIDAWEEELKEAEKAVKKLKGLIDEAETEKRKMILNIDQSEIPFGPRAAENAEA